MVGDILVFDQVLARSDVQLLINLPRIGRDNLSTHGLGQFDREFGLSGCRGTQNDQKKIRRKKLFRLMYRFNKFLNIAYITNLVHFSLLALLATTVSINAIPRTPSFTFGKSNCSGVGVLPSFLAATVAAKLRYIFANDSNSPSGWHARILVLCVANELKVNGAA